MSAADYRLLTEATGQRIAAALEALGVNAVQKSDIVDNLNSSDATKVLSAKQGKVLKDAIDTTNADMAIIINGNQTALGAAQGDYVLVRNSTITGISDGLYKAAAAIPANTAITSASLTAVSGGGFNDLQDQVTSLNSHIARNETFSTTETEIGTYRGLPLFRKVLTYGSYTDNSQIDILILGNNAYITKMYGVIVQNDGSRVAANHYYSADSYSSMWQGENNAVYFRGHPAGTSGRFVVEYTKSIPT